MSTSKLLKELSESYRGHHADAAAAMTSYQEGNDDGAGYPLMLAILRRTDVKHEFGYSYPDGYEIETGGMQFLGKAEVGVPVSAEYREKVKTFRKAVALAAIDLETAVYDELKMQRAKARGK